MKNRFFLMVSLMVAGGFVRAADEMDVIRFREPVVIQHGQEVTSAVSVGSYVQVEGTVRENAVSVGGDIRVGPTGVIEGDAAAVGGKVSVSPGGHVSGKITSTGGALPHLRRALAAVVPALIVGLGVLAGTALVVGSIGSIALAVLVLVLFPDQTRATRQRLEYRPWGCLLVGAVTLVLAIPVLVFLFMTLLGIPLAFVVAAVLMAALVLGTVALGQELGYLLARLIQKPVGPVPAGLIGLLLLTLICALPVVGVLAQTLIVCLALGAVFFSRFRSNLVDSD